MGRHSRREGESTDTGGRPARPARPAGPDGTSAPGVRASGAGPAYGPGHGRARDAALPDGASPRGVRGGAGPGREVPEHGGPWSARGPAAQDVSCRSDDGSAPGAVPGGYGARGGHPGQWEDAGGPGVRRGRPGDVPPGGPGFQRYRQRFARGPRQEYIDAFEIFDTPGEGASGAPGAPWAPGAAASGRTGEPPDEDDVFQPRGRTRRWEGSTAAAQASGDHDPYASVMEWNHRPHTATHTPGSEAPDAAEDTEWAEGAGETEQDGGTVGTGEPQQSKGGKGRAFTGILAAAVTTVLAVVAAGHLAGGQGKAGEPAEANGAQAVRQGAVSHDSADPSPSPEPRPLTLTYAQKMARKYPLGPTLRGSGKFVTVPGHDKAPGTGTRYTYRVEVEKGLGLDGALFAEAVQKTLNDSRSWAHNGARTFERVDTDEARFVITLASPGTTAEWCAMSGLDITEDNVSCDSAATERVMINAYRWAQGAETYGDRIYAYRQMLINHEVGHRLGYNHVDCEKDGALAPVMQQQTKFLDHDGVHCRANAWVYPTEN